MSKKANSKLLIYFFLFNFILASVFLLNFSKKANDGVGLFEPVVAWWNEANSVKTVSNDSPKIKFMSLSENQQIDILESTPIPMLTIEDKIVEPKKSYNLVPSEEVDKTAIVNSQENSHRDSEQVSSEPTHVQVQSDTPALVEADKEVEPIVAPEPEELANLSLDVIQPVEVVSEELQPLNQYESQEITIQETPETSPPTEVLTSSEEAIINQQLLSLNNFFNEENPEDLFLALNIDNENEVKENASEKLSEVSRPDIQIKNTLKEKVLPTSTKQSISHTPLCISYGPLNLEQKSSFDVLLQKYNIEKPLVLKSQDDLYEIYWNLGQNTEVAIELFERQKNEGALQDVRFKLKKDEKGNYIVPISTVAGNLEMANKLTQELKSTSKDIGGIWEYRAIDKGFFYQFPDIKQVDSNAVDAINQVITALKTVC